MPSLLVKYFSTETSQLVAVEDDGRVAYAYLIGADDRICGDVWLYNRCVAPEEPEWCSMDNAPFANPAPYVADCEAFRPANSGADFSAEWVREDAGFVAKLFLRGELLAVLKEGAKPGWALLAKKDGPLAKTLGNAFRSSGQMLPVVPV